MPLEECAEIIVSQCNGIHAPCEAFYIHSIIYSAERCCVAFDNYESISKEPENSAAVFGKMQETIIHAAALSRFFWPPRSRKAKFEKLHNARADKLREAFEMAEDSPLRFRGARDALDHFEERLDLFLLEHQAGTFFPGAIIGNVELAGSPASHIFKLVDPIQEKAIILGEVYDFGAIRSEVTRVLAVAYQCDSAGARLRTS